MLNTKLNLYNAEWLDVVFANKNKSYGAYDLRSHYAGNMVRAMLITFTVIAAGGVYLKLHAKEIEPVTQDRSIIVVITPPPPVVKVEKKVEPLVKQPPAKALPAAPTTKFLQYKVTSEPVTEEPPKISELTGNVGSETKKGDPDGQIALPIDLPVGPPSTPAPADNEVKTTIGLEVQPEPYGGMGAFSKFLGKNLRFPSAASDAGISGRVVVSFVIEKDGSLSNIVVEKGMGYGMDQEALRVLKLAKAWKPGRQNGQPVRVRYMIPIAFQMPE
ncbi:energy transducer TonB [Mucilaginibacter glaciei]|uniref:Energy transducer TonB n=1 Tax=Mucilaginibacter glaciei TaxID=2772109 RepID=A0A926NU89_9SPHI|nr:energy transducer TonB [Mucilaginibacter glaciei]MBD1391849.1 energy transducer TonB [Mucilaginibacter glaciei]